MGRLRTRGAVLVLGLVGAGIALLALTTTWARLGAGSVAGSVLTGRQAAPAAFALALASLAGLGVLLLVGRVGRRVVGVLLTLLGLGTALAAWVGATSVTDGSALPAAWDVTAADRVTTTVSWAVVAVVGGLLVAAAGVLAVVGAAGWSSTGTRYSRSGRPADTDLWRALDEGVDPTADE